MTPVTYDDPTRARRRRRRLIGFLIGTLGAVSLGAGQLSLALFTDQEVVPGTFSSGSVILDDVKIDALTLTTSGMVPGDTVTDDVVVEDDDTVRLTAIGCIALLALLVHFGPSVGLHAFSVRGPSMEPSIPQGAVVVAQGSDPVSIGVGELVTVRADNGVLVTHRVNRVTTAGPDRYFETKGDANGSPDPALVPAGNIVGRVIVVVPLAGYLVGMMTSLVGAMSIVAFLCAC